jgi:hypothetical protein
MASTEAEGVALGEEAVAAAVAAVRVGARSERGKE